jgi:hypothetical protein
MKYLTLLLFVAACTAAAPPTPVPEEPPVIRISPREACDLCEIFCQKNFGKHFSDAYLLNDGQQVQCSCGTRKIEEN